MSTLKELGNLDYGAVLLGICAILIAVKFVIENGDWFFKRFGIETKSMRTRREDHELLVVTSDNLKALQKHHEEDKLESIRHDDILRLDLQEVSNKMDVITNKLTDMQAKIDATEMAKLKDKILLYYRKYGSQGEWSSMESDTFWGLYDRYIDHGGNSFVRDSIAPVMRDLRINDK